MDHTLKTIGTWPQRAFLGIVLVKVVATLTLVFISFIKIQHRVDTRQHILLTVPCYFALFALAEIYDVFLTVSALIAHNILQIFGIIVFHICLIVAGALQVKQTEDALTDHMKTAFDNHSIVCKDNNDEKACTDELWRSIEWFQMSVPMVLAISLVPLIWLATRLFREFGWSIFHITNADVNVKRMFRYYQITLCLLKFDFFFFIGLTMQLLILVVPHQTTQFVLTIVAIGVVMVFLSACAYALKYEVKWLMYLTLLLMVAMLVYFGYKYERLFDHVTSHNYKYTRKTIATFLTFAIILLLTTMYCCIRCLLHFGKGGLWAKAAEPEIIPLPRRNGDGRGSYIPTPNSGDMKKGFDRRATIDLD